MQRFKPLPLILKHAKEKEQEQRREELLTTKDPSEDIEEFNSVRLISWKIKDCQGFFNNRASHINKMGKSNKNNKMPVSRNHSSETTMGPKIDVLINSNLANFPSTLIAVNNVYNFDTHPWPKNSRGLHDYRVFLNEQLHLWG